MNSTTDTTTAPQATMDELNRHMDARSRELTRLRIEAERLEQEMERTRTELAEARRAMFAREYAQLKRIMLIQGQMIRKFSKYDAKLAREAAIINPAYWSPSLEIMKIYPSSNLSLQDREGNSFLIEAKWLTMSDRDIAKAYRARYYGLRRRRATKAHSEARSTRRSLQTQLEQAQALEAKAAAVEARFKSFEAKYAE